MLHVAVTWLTLYCLLYTCVGLCVALCLIEGKVCMTGGRVGGGMSSREFAVTTSTVECLSSVVQPTHRTIEHPLPWRRPTSDPPASVTPHPPRGGGVSH